jgi:hypothetical protein
MPRRGEEEASTREMSIVDRRSFRIRADHFVKERTFTQKMMRALKNPLERQL